MKKVYILIAAVILAALCFCGCGNADAAGVAEYLFRSIGGNSLGVRKRYRDLLKIFHPDNLFGDLELAQALSKEYQKRRDNQ